MFGNTFGLPHLIIILVIVLLLFGAPKLPGLARSIGQSMKIFRTEIKGDDKPTDEKGSDAASDATSNAASNAASNAGSNAETPRSDQSGTPSTQSKSEH